MKGYHCKSIKQILFEFGQTANGYSTKQVEERSGSKRPNILEGKKKSFISKFIQQFSDFMIIILLISSTISITIGLIEGASGEIIDGCIILAIVVLNAIFGIVQENKAEQAMSALKKLTAQECVVIRNGAQKKIKADELVLGDLVVIDAGDIIPADLRLIESKKLKINEATLTGESEFIEKDCEKIYTEDSLLGDRRNMAYKGCEVNYGRGVGIVVALGEDSELGKIAHEIKQQASTLSPLQKSIKDVGKILTYFILAVSFITFVIEVVNNPTNIMDAFLTAVALAVAAIPESMPAVITIIMSLGVARLAKKKAVVRKMHSVETLGCCNVVCSDKTGTITQNKMNVVSVFSNGKLKKSKFNLREEDKALIECCLLCNDSTVDDKGKLLGDSTEIALVEFCKSLGVYKEKFLSIREDELPFDSTRKMMSVLCKKENKRIMYTKGAIDRVLNCCDEILIGETKQPLTEEIKRNLLLQNEGMCEKALRVIALAYKEVNLREDFKEDGLVFIGLLGMIDPPRKEIKKAIEKCKRAGMKPVMITGDYGKTAFAIAKEIGLASDMSQVITGEELSRFGDDKLSEEIEKYCVFARVSPSDKVRIVEAFRKKGKVVSMTGDGVNDAPSLRKADIGIGMGISGTDVTKEVADIIITDDNFATIIVAVEEGRKIYQNIQKTVKFLFSANFAEMLSLFIATIVFPQFVFLYPVQILFINLITDSLPAIALGVEEPETNLMDMPPRDRKKGLFANGNGVAICVLGFIQTMLVVASYVIGLKLFNQSIATTLAFFTMNIIQMFYLASVRTKASIFKSKPYKNKLFLLAVGFCFVMMALFAFTPLRELLKLEVLSVCHWAIVFGLSVIMLIISELYKLIEKLIVKKRLKR